MTELRKPPRLQPGDLIGVAAPAGTFNHEALLAGVKVLKDAGFEIQMREDINARERYFAGSEQRRADEMNQLLSDPKVRAIVCARGGYGTQRILPLLDVGDIKEQPKIFVGYSDLTVLHAYLHHHCHWVTYYGPTVCQHMGPQAPKENLAWLLQVLTSEQPFGPTPSDQLRVIKEGTAEGPLVGGCLTLVQTGIGTIYEWPLAGGICFLEDRGEKIYALDRMLTHLKHAGAFRDVQGIVFGSLLLHPEEKSPEELDTMLADIFHDFPGPVVAGLPAGHCDPCLTLPLGCRASLTTDPPRLNIDSGAVA